MSRTKGSKNKPKITNDFASQIAEKQESITSLTNEVASITANIDTLKADLKEKKNCSQVDPERTDEAGIQESCCRSEGRRSRQEERSGKPREKAAGRWCQCRRYYREVKVIRCRVDTSQNRSAVARPFLVKGNTNGYGLV